MVRGAVLVSILAALATVVSLRPGHAFPEPRSAPASEVVPGELIVRWRAGASMIARSAARATAGAALDRRFSTPDLELLDVGDRDPVAVAAELRGHPDVLYAEPSYRVYALGSPRRFEAPAGLTLPDDPRFGEMWGLRNVGQTGGTIGADMRAVAAWQVFTGDPDVLVGVIDTGIDYEHPDLAPNVWTNPGEIPGNRIDDDGNGYVDDVHGYDFANDDGDPRDGHGHGTHVAGTIAARGDNGIGVAGVSWRAKLVAIKFLGDDGRGSTAAAVQAIEYAIAVGARLTNNSWGGGPYSQAVYDAIQHANAVGQLFVAAAGNEGRDIDGSPNYPGSYDLPNVVSVGATNHLDQLAAFSNRGVVQVDLAAPGELILSTLPGGQYGLASGTSMASPHVAGVLALMYGRRPGLDAAQARALLLAGVDSVPALAGLVRRAGRLNAAIAIGDPDTIPPGPISDLTATSTVTNAVALSWTATGDDGDAGRSSSYDVRYATAPITAATFASALAAPPPDPPAAGEAVHAEVAGLAFGTAYWFAVRARDEYGNPGPISNVAAAATPAPPRLEIAPAAVDHTLLSGTSATRTVLLHNRGEGALDFTIPTPAFDAGTAAIQPYTELAQGAPDPRVGPPVLDARGGPDAAGYRWIDSLDPDGPEFAWIDLSAIGLPLAITGDEDIDVDVPLGFDFPFYGRTFDHVNVAVNGWLSFTSTVIPTFTNQPLPNLGARVPENLIAPFWADLSFGNQPRAFYHTDGERFVVSWINAPHYFFPASYTFQVVLESNGTIRFQYLEIHGVREFSTVGIQNATKDVGLQVSFNTRYVRPGLAVRIEPAPEWLTVTPRQGRVLGGASRAIDFQLRSGELLGGRYGAEVEVLSNDPAAPRIAVPVRLEIDGVPDVELSRASLDFGSLFVGGARTDTVIVRNPGTDTLRVSGVTSDHPSFGATPATLAVPPRGALPLAVTFTALGPGAVTGLVTLRSDDPDEPEAGIVVSGTGVPPPDIGVAATGFDETLPVGGLVERRVRIDNAGVSPLTVELGVESATAARVAAARGVVLGASRGVERAGAEDDSGVASPGAAPIGPTANDAPSAAPPSILAGSYAGAHLAFGLTDRGELMPFQSPAGAEHLRVSAALSGYTVGYVAEGDTRVYYAGHDQVFGILPVSYHERVADAQRVVVDVVTRTLDERLRIHRTFEFARADRFVRVTTRLENAGTLPVTGVVLKEFADWDADGDAADDDWQVDRDLNAVIASDVGHVAIASDRRPRHLDVLGWTDAGVYVTRPDSGPLTDADGLALIDHDLGDLPAGARTPAVRTAFAAHADLEELRLVLGRAVPDAGWMRPAPARFTVAPGAGVDVTLAFDARDRLGGDYHGFLRIESNDPDEGVVRVPATLRVVGVPRLVAATSLAHDTTYTGFATAETLVVRNEGSDSLRVAGLVSSHPAFQAAAGAFALGPRRERRVPVTFAPADPGFVTATLTLATNDREAPAHVVSLAAMAVDPPHAVVVPAAIAARALAGARARLPLRIENRGGSRLEATIEVTPEPAAATVRLVPDAEAPVARGAGGPRRAEARPGLLAVEDWAAWIGRAPREAAAPSAAGAAATDDVPPVVIEDPEGDSERVDLVRFRASALTGELRVRLDLATRFDRSNFGGVISLDLDRDPTTGFRPSYGLPAQDVGADAEISLFVVAYGVVELYLPGRYAGAFPIRSDTAGFSFAIPLAALEDDGHMNVSGVVGAGGPSDWFPDAGHGTINPAGWLTLAPASVRVLPGESVVLDAVLDASRLPAGEYRARVTIATNDPRPGARIEVPARFEVTTEPPPDPPRLELSTGALRTALAPSLGAEATRRAMAFAIANRGASPLEWTALAAGAPWLAASPAHGVVAPGDRVTVAVAFDATGLADGLHVAALGIATNDPTRAAASVACTVQVGAVPSRFELAPGHLEPRSNGRWVNAKLTLPSGWDPRDLDLAGVRVLGVPIAADGPASVAGQELHFKIDRAALLARLPGSGEARVDCRAEHPHVRWFGGETRVTVGSRGGRAASAGVETAAPERFGLRLASGHPAVGGVVLELAMPEPGAAAVDVLDVRGARVRRVLAEDLAAGWHRVRWDGRGDAGAPAAPGVYFVRAVGAGASARLRCVLVR